MSALTPPASYGSAGLANEAPCRTVDGLSAIKRVPGSGHWCVAEEAVRCGRQLLASAAATLRDHPAVACGPSAQGMPCTVRWRDELPGIDEAVRLFIPTAIMFRDPGGDYCAELCMDFDHTRPARFVSAVCAVEATISIAGDFVKRQAARAFLAPPATPEEAALRAERLVACCKGAPLGVSDGWRSGLLTGKLGTEERWQAQALTPDEQVALVTVLAATEGVAITLSPGGNWPASRLVAQVAGRLACHLVRLDLDGIPSEAIHHLRDLRYTPVLSLPESAPD